MCRRPKETLLQKRHTDGQHAHEKILNVTRETQIKTSIRYHPHMGQNSHHQIINTGEDMEKREPFCTVDGM